MSDYKQYRRNGITEMRPYAPGESMDGVSISEPDKAAGCPKPGDWIARKPSDHSDVWLVSAKTFAELQFVEVAK